MAKKSNSGGPMSTRSMKSPKTSKAKQMGNEPAGRRSDKHGKPGSCSMK